MITPAYVRTMAAYNAEMNRRLYEAANRLFEATQPQIPSGRMRLQILDEAAGNPLALLELAGTTTHAGGLPVGGGDGAPTAGNTGLAGTTAGRRFQ